MSQSCRWCGLLLQRRRAAHATGNFFKVQIHIADSEYAKSSQQRITLADNVYLISVRQEGAFCRSIGNRPVTIEFHRQRGRRRRRWYHRPNWTWIPPRFGSLTRGRHSHSFAEQIAPAALVFSFPRGCQFIAPKPRIFHSERRVRLRSRPNTWKGRPFLIEIENSRGNRQQSTEYDHLSLLLHYAVRK